jgi:hypothetical protein
MAYAVVHHFPGGTKEQYEASIAAVHPNRSSLPKGQIYHAAGPSAGGWTIIAVHDSKESWERFRDNILLPKFRQGIKGGFANMPQETTFEVFNLQSLVSATH